MAKPKPPGRIKILDETFTVRYSADELENKGAWGDIDRKKRVIQLQPSASQPTILIHELLHALEGALLPDKELPEPTIIALSVGLATILLDNPELVAWIQEVLA